jgi:hypothetical protein
MVGETGFELDLGQGANRLAGRRFPGFAFVSDQMNLHPESAFLRHSPS